MTWWDYVTAHRGGDSDTQVGAKVGIASSSVARWKKSAPSPDNVRAFAESYRRPVVEAFIAAGFFTEEQAGARISRTVVPGQLTNQQLLNELATRLAGRQTRPVRPTGRNAPLSVITDSNLDQDEMAAFEIPPGVEIGVDPDESR